MQHGCNKHGPGKSQNKDTESSVGLAISCQFALKGTSDSGQFEILTTCLKFCNFPLCRKALMWKIEEGGNLQGCYPPGSAFPLALTSNMSGE